MQSDPKKSATPNFASWLALTQCIKAFTDITPRSGHRRAFWRSDARQERQTGLRSERISLPQFRVG